MNSPKTPDFDHMGWLDNAMTVLALRLRQEVGLHRALKGGQGQEGFGGILLDADEAENMLEQMAGTLRASPSAAAIAQLEQAQRALDDAASLGGAKMRFLRDMFGLSHADCDLLILTAAPAIDPRFGRIYGFLNDDVARRYLTPTLAHKLLTRHDLTVLQARKRLDRRAPLIRHAVIQIGPERPLAEAPMRVDETMVDWLLDPVAVPRVVPIPDAPEILSHRPAGRTIDIASALTSATPDVAVRLAVRNAWLAASPPVVCGLDDLPDLALRSLALAPPPANALFLRQPHRWYDVGGTGQADKRDALRDRAFSGLAERVRGRLTLDDLVLPAACDRQLQGFVSAARSYKTVLGDWGLGAVFGKTPGLCGLFKGPSGTGKTTAALAIAEALDLPLYRINLAGLVSKYIGDTEKQLDALFDAAQEHACMLLFDEADALFGARSDVKDAHDRYANQGTAFLLQRLEAHQGICVLTTNLHENIDDAFLRRIDAVIDFPAPQTAEREKLWRRLQSADAPVATLDLDWLASHPLTGGEIANCCLTAAYAAQAKGTQITTGGLALSIANTLAKKGKPVLKSAFGSHYASVRGAGG